MRLAVGVACAVVGVLVELGLDQVVAVAPWLIVAFGAGLVAAILGGPTGGAAAAIIGVAAQVSVVRAWVPGTALLDGAGPTLDTAVAAAGLGFGLWIRGLLLQPAPRLPFSGVPARDRSSLAAGDVPPRSSGSRPDAPVAISDDAAAILLRAVRDVDTARTPVQVADLLARHGAALAGAPGAVVLLRRPGPGGPMTIQGRFGEPLAPATNALGTRGDPADEGAPTVDIPLSSGPEPTGVLRLLHGPDGRRPELTPAVTLLVRMASDALQRSSLHVAQQRAEASAADAAARVASLGRLAAELVGATTVDEVARTLVDLALDELLAGFAVLHVPDASGASFALVHARGYPAGLMERERRIGSDVGHPVTRAAAEGRIVEVSGDDGWREAFPKASNVPGIAGVRAISAIPMQAGGTLQGVLVIGWRTAEDRSAVDRGLLATAADQGAQALERARLHAQEADARRLQEAFIGVVSHELRTPITTILAGSRILRRRLDGDAAAADLSDDIAAEADRLSRIVEDLLVLSRLERRHLTLGDEPVHLDHLLARVVRSEAERWPTHEFVVARAGRNVVRGDETYIEQVLRNLASNAAKYSPSGSTVEVAVDDAAPDEVGVRVLDRGSGIAPAEVDDLFSLFYRSPTTAASAAGAGIGLFVSRRLVDEMGGRMWARPRPDGGSEFGFSLARYPAEDEDDGGLADEGAVAGPDDRPPAAATAAD
ncbi:MAG TPA: ATP-binding protein [Candidatus Limnocylindrales bacterium]|nr:ATP-binding protein [Candidatus Limnocylindrales bacterium]